MGSKLTELAISRSAEETKRLAAALAGCAQAGDVVVLNGDLGAGKTQFVQGLAEGLGIADAVTSPTYNILLTYESGRLSLNHFDLYRLESSEELDDIGYWEALESGGVSCIEWGDKFPDDMPDDYLDVRISPSEQGERIIRAEAHGPRSGALLGSWICAAD